MLPSLNEKQLIAAARLVRSDPDFKEIMEYIKGAMVQTAMDALNKSGTEGDKYRGAGLGLRSLYDALSNAEQDLERRMDNLQDDSEDRDMVSP